MRSLWRWLETCLEQHLAHGSRRNRDPETLELADDPFVSPVRVLPSETKDQLAERALEPWSPRPPVRVCPPAGDQLAVPAKQCLRLEQEGRPGRPGKRAAQRRQQRAICSCQLRPRGLAAEDRQLMAEDEVSRPGESHPRALSDPDVSLSTHPAPIIQPWAARPDASGRRGLALAVRGSPRTSVLVRRGRAAACTSSWPNERGSR